MMFKNYYAKKLIYKLRHKSNFYEPTKLHDDILYEITFARDIFEQVKKFLRRNFCTISHFSTSYNFEQVEFFNFDFFINLLLILFFYNCYTSPFSSANNFLSFFIYYITFFYFLLCIFVYLLL